MKTPGFDRVTRGGVIFSQAYTRNAKCAASRACMLTGRDAWQLEEACNHGTNFWAMCTAYMEGVRAHVHHTGYTMKGGAPYNPVTANGAPRELTGTAWRERMKPLCIKEIIRFRFQWL